MAISFCWAIGIVSHGDIGILIGLDFNMGDLWMVAAVLSWAVYTVCLQQCRPAGFILMLLLAVLTVVGLVLSTPVYAWEISTGKTISLTTAALAGIAYQGVFPAFLGYVFYAHAVKEIGGSKAGLFLYLTPVFGTFLSVAFLGELPRSISLCRHRHDIFRHRSRPPPGWAWRCRPCRRSGQGMSGLRAWTK